jgi:hypothetical protein
MRVARLAERVIFHSSQQHFRIRLWITAGKARKLKSPQALPKIGYFLISALRDAFERKRQDLRSRVEFVYAALDLFAVNPPTSLRSSLEARVLRLANTAAATYVGGGRFALTTGFDIKAIP